MIAIVFPPISPIALSFGPINIYWYALAYIVGIGLGYYYLQYLNSWKQFIPAKSYDDLMFYTVLGIIVGGRLGYVLFYDFFYYLENPHVIVMTWRGGMSFHGGLIGVIIAAVYLSRKYKFAIANLLDLISAVAPIGIFLGRVANFINGELYGRVTDVSWGVIFPMSEGIARHPSQIYEAILEGLLPLGIMYFLIRKYDILENKWQTSGVFILLYSIGRIIAEFFREPNYHIGYILSSFTLGQLLTVPFLILGTYLVFFMPRQAKQKKKA
jgi:phosphatidylglycerol:prolipoprotein diacylglycerol transferase